MTAVALLLVGFLLGYVAASCRWTPATRYARSYQGRVVQIGRPISASFSHPPPVTGGTGHVPRRAQ